MHAKFDQENLKLFKVPSINDRFMQQFYVQQNKTSQIWFSQYYKLNLFVNTSCLKTSKKKDNSDIDLMTIE